MVSPQTVYDLGRAWYATRMDREWERANREQAEAIFARCGLDGAFWSLA